MVLGQFAEDFDICIALHVCGAGTDLAMLKAVRRGAAYFVSPCCVGKLQASAGLVDPTRRAPSEVRGASPLRRIRNH